MKSVDAQKRTRPNKAIACPRTIFLLVREIRAILGAIAAKI
jgi:hypothetical protein